MLGFCLVALVLLKVGAGGQLWGLDKRSILLEQRQNNHDEEDCTGLFARQQYKVELNELLSACQTNNIIRNLRIICRHSTYIILEWASVLDTDLKIQLNLTFKVEKWSTNGTRDNLVWTYYGTTTERRVKVGNLTENTEYKFQVSAFYDKHRLGRSAASEYITTFIGNESLRALDNVRVKEYRSLVGSLSAILSWNHSKDGVCEVFIILPGKNGGINIKKVEGENSVELPGLLYDATYLLKLYSKVRRAESQPVRFKLSTPSCSTLTSSNYSICAPDQPENLIVEETCTDLRVSWDQPPVTPSYYSILFLSDKESKNFTVGGNETSLHVSINEVIGYYSFQVVAYGPAGGSQPARYGNLLRCHLLKDLPSNKNNRSVDLSGSVDLSIEGDCHPEVKWSKLNDHVSHYLIKITHNNQSTSVTVPGDRTSIKLNKTYDGDLTINLTVFEPGGAAKRQTAFKKLSCSQSKPRTPPILNRFPIVSENLPSYGKGVVIIITALAIPSIIISAILIYLCVNKSYKDIDGMRPEDSFRKVSCNKYEEMEPQEPGKDEKSVTEDDVFDEYEVSRDNVRLCQILGEGQFGVVHKAVLVQCTTYLKYVAVKTLRNKESVEGKRQLEKEMEVMKSVGRHRNIVSLLGCCSEQMMLIVEFCSLGDLRRFLRKTWRAKYTTEDAMWEKGGFSLVEQRAFSNLLYEKPVAERHHLNLSMMDLLSFARQIAAGMAYLSENRVVHRDLAARNVLLTEDMTAKIADFGLSRDVYERNIYMKRSSDRLPLRWMALESLQYQIFSTKSDVWSYGVLLWEIMTLGGCPYPSLQTSEMYKLLQEGYRMERPKPCTPPLYEIMLSCWDAKPQNRPNFSQVLTKVEEILKNESNRSYLDLSACDYKIHLDEGCDIK